MAFTLRFRTQLYRRVPEVTIRDSVSGWSNNILGTYTNDEWRFQLPIEPYQAGFEFKFMLDRSIFMKSDNIKLTPVPGGDYVYSNQGPNRVEFDSLTELNRPPIIESGAVQNLFFRPNLDEQELYDVIVIGSGIGGGVAADQLSDSGKSVLVLEAGSYLFPTHVANLPRQQTPGRFSKHVWGLWDEFRVRNTVNMGGEYNGCAGINFGGRSIFWGGLIPRMTPTELESWPEPIRTYLLQGPDRPQAGPEQKSGYARAEQLMNASGPPPSAYQTRVLGYLSSTLGEAYAAAPAGVAVQYSDGERATIPAGMFSTADLLMESALSEGKAGRQNLTINLNHRVVRLETAAGRVTGVTARDLIADKLRTYRAEQVLLAAGTIESAKIVKLSNLVDPSGQVGKGITDHPVFYTHFGLPANSRWNEAGASAKILLQHKDFAAHPYNVVIELASDFNQGRYVDTDALQENEAAKAGLMLCEVVFLFDAPLLETNGVAFGADAADKPEVTMERSPVANRHRAEAIALKDAIVRAFGGVVLQNDNLNLNEANLGDVAHEDPTPRTITRVAQAAQQQQQPGSSNSSAAPSPMPPDTAAAAAAAADARSEGSGSSSSSTFPGGLAAATPFAEPAAAAAASLGPGVSITNMTNRLLQDARPAGECEPAGDLASPASSISFQSMLLAGGGGSIAGSASRQQLSDVDGYDSCSTCGVAGSTAAAVCKHSGGAEGSTHGRLGGSSGELAASAVAGAQHMQQQLASSGDLESSGTLILQPPYPQPPMSSALGSQQAAAAAGSSSDLPPLPSHASPSLRGGSRLSRINNSNVINSYSSYDGSGSSGAAPTAAAWDAAAPAAAGGGFGVKVAALALLHPNLSGHQVPPFTRLLAGSSLGRSMLRPLLRSEVGEVTNRRAWANPDLISREVLALYRRPLRVQGWDAALLASSQAAGSISQQRVAAQFAAARQLPTLLVTGEHDRIATPAKVSAVAALLLRSQQAVVPGCGHLSHEEAPARLLQLLVPFCRSRVAPAAAADLLGPSRSAGSTQ